MINYNERPHIKKIGHRQYLCENYKLDPFFFATGVSVKDAFINYVACLQALAKFNLIGSEKK